MCDQEYFKANEQREKNEERGGRKEVFHKTAQKNIRFNWIACSDLHCGRDCRRG